MSDTIIGFFNGNKKRDEPEPEAVAKKTTVEITDQLKVWEGEKNRLQIQIKQEAAYMKQNKIRYTPNCKLKKLMDKRSTLEAKINAADKGVGMVEQTMAAVEITNINAKAVGAVKNLSNKFLTNDEFEKHIEEIGGVNDDLSDISENMKTLHTTLEDFNLLPGQDNQDDIMDEINSLLDDDIVDDVYIPPQQQQQSSHITLSKKESSSSSSSLSNNNNNDKTKIVTAVQEKNEDRDLLNLPSVPKTKINITPSSNSKQKNMSYYSRKIGDFST